jgi:ABC-2 type transport system ATP-binding protein
VIEATALSKRFGRTTAVDGLTFTIRPGHVTGFLGPNGAGKSTTMRMILGLDAPTTGTVTVNGQPYQAIHRPLHEVGAVLEVRAVHGGRSAYHHLLALAQSNGIHARRVREVLELVGLDGVGRRRAGKFSLGMSQRLGLAAALLGDPPILICDEPVNGLDPDGILWIRTLLRGLAAEGRTVFVSSHLMSEMALTADHLIVIGQGKLLADASTTDLIAGNSHSYVSIRTPNATELADLLRRAGANVAAQTDGADDRNSLQVSRLDTTAIGDIAAAHGIAIHGLTPHTASLETAYMELTRDHVDFHTDSAPTGRATLKSPPTGGER